MDTNTIVVKKKSKFWTVVAIILAVGAVCFVAAKVYQKFFKKKTDVCELDDGDEFLALDDAEELDADEEAVEVAADAVIANVEDMEETEEN